MAKHSHPVKSGLFNAQICYTAALAIDITVIHITFNPEIQNVYMGKICDSNYKVPERKIFIWYYFNSYTILTSSSNLLLFYSCLCSKRLNNYSVTVNATNKRDVPSLLTQTAYQIQKVPQYLEMAFRSYYSFPYFRLSYGNMYFVVAF